MFKKGDIVRCTNNNYKITSLFRPCKVIQGEIYGKILVKPFDYPCVLEVEEEFFEIVPQKEIIYSGQKISVTGFNNLVTFKCYMDNGFIRVETDDYYKDIELSKVIY